MSGPQHFEPGTTEIAVTGANCPYCFNEVLDQLRAEPGVTAVDGNLAGACVRVDHDGVDADRLVAIVGQRLHVDTLSSNERVMDSLEPRTAVLGCTHRAPAAER